MTDSGNLVDKVWNDIANEKGRKEKRKQGEKEEIAITRARITKLQGLMALRSGFEQRTKDDMIDKFAATESQAACNGVQN